MSNKYIEDIDKTQRVFGSLTLLHATNRRSDKYILYKCKCVCGKTIETTINKLRTGHRRSCGCKRHITAVGKEINNFLIEKVIRKTETNNYFYSASCLTCKKSIEGQIYQIKKNMCCNTHI